MACAATHGDTLRNVAGAPFLAIFGFVSDAVMQVFRETGAYLKGHFRLTSGLHSNEYLQCALVLQHPAIAEGFGRELAGQLPACDVVISPAIGGLPIGHEVAKAKGARFIFTERDVSGKMILRRGFSLRPGEAALVIEDVVTTGGTTREVIDVATAAGARVLAAGSIIDRSGGRVDLGVPRVALATLDVVAYPPDFCPMCQQGLPVEKPGSRNTV
jgi:orotate phosphoribosyltransferase